MANKVKWTKSMIRKVEKLTREGYRIGQIAIKLGITTASVQYARKKYKIEGGKYECRYQEWTLAEDKIVMDDSKAGIPVTETADKLGRSVSSVRNRLHILNHKKQELGWGKCIAELKNTLGME